MSRTDKTNPFLVKLWDGTLERVARHDHTNGVCDLPMDLTEHTSCFESNGTAHRCTWELHFSGVSVCCCSLCRAQPWERAARSGRRRRTRVTLQEIRKIWFAGGEGDFD